MTPEQQAKMKVAAIFAALSAYPEDTRWHELVRGGFETNARITGGILSAHVGHDGEYAVYAGKNDVRLVTLISGSFALSTDHQPYKAVNGPSKQVNDGWPGGLPEDGK